MNPLQPTSELSQRVMTGALGAAALILLITVGGWIGICLLTAVISFAMIYEFSEMSFTLSDRVEKRYALLLLTWVISVVNLLLPRSEYELLILSFLSLFCFYLFTTGGKEGETFQAHFRELKYSLFGLVYLVFLPLYLPRVHDCANGVHWTLLFFFINWAGDSAAYFVGKKYGTKKLYPHISPKKTVEGAYGGLAAGVIITLLYRVIFFRSLPWAGVLIMPLIVGAFAQVGDLCESFLKRAYGKKDSGTLLPGHGGFLDRFDGVVFSLPVMYACTRLFN